jgi:hypothetical protein
MAHLIPLYGAGVGIVDFLKKRPRSRTLPPDIRKLFSGARHFVFEAFPHNSLCWMSERCQKVGSRGTRGSLETHIDEVIGS